MEDLDIEYQLSYSLLLAEQEMLESLLEQEIQFVANDTIDSTILTEGVKESVMTYLQKVVSQLQQVWIKFNKSVTSKLNAKLADSIGASIAKNKGKIDFLVNYYGEMDLDKMNTFKVKPWQIQDYEQHKEDYESKDKYLAANYPALKPDSLNEGRNLKKCMIDNIVIQHRGFKVDDQVLAEMLEFLKNGYKKAVADLEEDINNINTSSQNISNAVKTIMSAETSANESFAFLESVYSDLFTEADEPENAEKMTFTDTSGETTSDDKKEDKEKSAIVKHVSVYMSVAMGIISAKMSIINRAASDRLKILMHYNNSLKGNNTAVTNDNKGTGNAAPGVTEVPQVDVNKK